MPRVKRGMHHAKRRKNILKRTKGFELGRKSLLKLAKTADTKAGAHAYSGRKIKKRVNRGLWNVKINASLRAAGMTYSKFIGALKKNTIALDRKVLSQIAEAHPSVFTKIIESVK